METTQTAHAHATKFSQNSRVYITHLIQIDHRLPELILRLVEISHADLSEVPRVVFVEIRSVMVLSTGHTTSTGVLAVFAYAAVAGGDVAATVGRNLLAL